MVSAEERKQDILDTINENPVEITIDIRKRTIVNGAWKLVDDTKELTVRIFQQKSPEVITISDIKGTADTTKKYGMLADYTVDLLDTADEKITFNSPYGKMELLAIYPQIVRGETCGYQCDLKRVS